MRGKCEDIEGDHQEARSEKIQETQEEKKG